MIINKCKLVLRFYVFNVNVLFGVKIYGLEMINN